MEKLALTKIFTRGWNLIYNFNLPFFSRQKNKNQSKKSVESDISVSDVSADEREEISSSGEGDPDAGWITKKGKKNSQKRHSRQNSVTSENGGS